MDEDVRGQRIGILCLEKVLTPALTQALFRVKEQAQVFHENRINSNPVLTDIEKKEHLRSFQSQMREVKWSELNLPRSYIAKGFIENFFHYCCKGPLLIMFFNTPFRETHKDSIAYFFSELPKLKIPDLENLQHSGSTFFLDTFTSAPGFRFEEVVRDSHNLSRCFRIDSRAHDIMQLTDLLLGITVFKKLKKETKSRAKLTVLNEFDLEFAKTLKKGAFNGNKCVYYVD